MNDPDPTVATHYRSLAAAFRDLQHSSNPIVSGYWLAAMRRSQASGAQVKTERAIEELLGGTENTIYAKANKEGYLHSGMAYKTSRYGSRTWC